MGKIEEALASIKDEDAYKNVLDNATNVMTNLELLEKIIF